MSLHWVERNILFVGKIGTIAQRIRLLNDMGDGIISKIGAIPAAIGHCNNITVLIMEVPCCGGLLQLVQLATQRSTRKVPVKAVTVGIKGTIIDEQWV